MSETYGNTGSENYDATRELGSVGAAPSSSANSSSTSSLTGTSESGGAKEVAHDEARATAERAKEGASHVATVGTEELKNVAQETSQQAKELWQQTRNEMLHQSADQQARVAEGLRSLSQELSSMARASDQKGVASDLAQQASQRMGDVAGWLDARDPGSLVTEVKRFARQRPGAFLATAAVVGLVGGRLSRGLVADHQDQSSTEGETGSTNRQSVDATPVPAAEPPVSGPMTDAAGLAGGPGAISGTGTAGEYPR